MPRGNPSPKLAITVDPDVHAAVVEAAAAEGVSVSAWMTAAARRALRVRSGLAAVARDGVGSRQRAPDQRGTRRRPAPHRHHHRAPDRMTRVVYDAGVLVAADRNVRAIWADHRIRLEAGIIPVVPAPVIARSAAPPPKSSSAACCADARSSP